MIQMPDEVAAIVRRGPRPLEKHEYEKIVNWLAGHHLRVLLKLAVHWLGRPAWDAEDAVQEFFASKFQQVCEGYDPEKNPNFVAYLCVCLRKHCWSEGKWLRGDDTRMQQHIDVESLLEIILGPSPDSNPEEQTSYEEMLKAIETCLNDPRLPQARREVIVAFCFEGRSQKDIAKIRSSSADAVKQKVRNARITLRDCLQARGISLDDFFGKRPKKTAN